MTTSKYVFDVEILKKLGEHFAAGLFECSDAAPATRFCRAYSRWFENRGMEQYDNKLLFPSRQIILVNENSVLQPAYSFTMSLNQKVFEEKISKANAKEKEILEHLKQFHDEYFQYLFKSLKTPHGVGGMGFTHAIINYGRVVREGLDAYQCRIEKNLSICDTTQRDFYKGLLDVISGIKTFHRNAIAYLEKRKAECGNASKLIDALKQVPLKPARNYYEAIVCYNFIYYVDGCDNPGRIDQELFPYYENDPATDHNSALLLMSDFFDNVCANYGWSSAIGGSNADGSPAYNEVTEICLEASRNRFRPSLELRVREDMPDKIWHLSADALATGCGQPAFYNEKYFIDAIKSSCMDITDEDIAKWNGGGCSEMMIHGCSNVGSLDAGFNLLLVLEDTLKENLGRPGITFEQLIEAYKSKLAVVIHDVTVMLNEYFACRAKYLPQPIRSLFMDDCIDNGKDFNNGGARYNWSVVNVAGVANVADSLQAIREVVYVRKNISGAALLAALESNFENNEKLRQELLGCAKFGNDLNDVDSLASDISEFVYKTLTSQKRVSGKFIPSHIMFETYAWAGNQVGATPDGRLARSPISDSSGPMQGRDTHGPTAMLKSVAKLPLHMAWGTPVLNLKLSKKMFASGDSREHLRSLVETYFSLGGMQLQISVLDRDELLDAVKNPAAHQNLIVRIGGYSTYFNCLSKELKEEVIKRTEYVIYSS